MSSNERICRKMTRWPRQQSLIFVSTLEHPGQRSISVGLVSEIEPPLTIQKCSLSIWYVKAEYLELFGTLR